MAFVRFAISCDIESMDTLEKNIMDLAAEDQYSELRVVAV